MSAEITALAAALDSPGVPVVIGAANLPPPFVVIWGTPGVISSDPSVEICGDWSAQVGITCTGQDAQAALDLAALVRDKLFPRLAPAVLSGVPGRHVAISLTESRAVQIDRTVSLTSTDTHPAYCVLLLEMTSQPIGEQ